MKQIILLFIVSFSISCTSKFYVAPKMADCVLDGKSSCYLIKSNLQENWLMIPEDIYEFKYEEGYIYRIKVKTVKIKDSFNNNKTAYRLVEVLSKEEFTGKKISARLIPAVKTGLYSNDDLIIIKEKNIALALEENNSCLFLQVLQ